MVITRTPFRISFFGGGTDYPAWYERNNGGLVISTSINKYCYVTTRFLPPFFDHTHRIRYSKREEVKSVDEIQHPSVRECLRFLGIEKGVEIVHTSDLPAMSGLGSSSSFTVGLLHALRALTGKIATKRQLALDAIHVEQERIKESVGSQDQTVAAFGGFNRIEFGGPQNIAVHPITIPRERMEALQNHLMLFFTGYSRNASDIAAEQIQKTPENGAHLTTMMRMAEEALGVLQGDGSELDDIGRLLHESWQIKRALSSKISNGTIDEIYESGKDAGALGGKLLGAGGGGFMLFFVRPERQPSVREKLRALLHVPFGFENLGSQIIYYAPEQNF